MLLRIISLMLIVNFLQSKMKYSIIVNPEYKEKLKTSLKIRKEEEIRKIEKAAQDDSKLKERWENYKLVRKLMRGVNDNMEIVFRKFNVSLDIFEAETISIYQYYSKEAGIIYKLIFTLNELIIVNDETTELQRLKFNGFECKEVVMDKYDYFFKAFVKTNENTIQLLQIRFNTGKLLFALQYTDKVFESSQSIRTMKLYNKKLWLLFDDKTL